MNLEKDLKQLKKEKTIYDDDGNEGKKIMAKLCPRGKAAAKRKFKVYPSAYA